MASRTALVLETNPVITERYLDYTHESDWRIMLKDTLNGFLEKLQQERGLTFMFITHDLSVVNHFSDDIAVMYLGNIVEKAPAEELFAHPLHPYTEALLSAIPIPSRHNRRKRIVIKGEITSPINLPDECRFAGRCNYAEECCRNSIPELVEVRPDHFVACARLKEIRGI